MFRYNSTMNRTLILMMYLLYQSVEKCCAVNFHRSVHHRFGTSMKSMSSRGVVYLSQSIRGGGQNDDNMATDSEDSTLHSIDRRQLIGVIDVRSKAEADHILLIGSSKNIDKDSTGRILVDGAMFSVSSNCNQKIADELSSQDEIDQHKAAAAALTVGSTCQTIYLILTYDFKDGKTVLHRTLGGIKLMNLVDGVRKRWNDSSEASLTRLILILLPPNNEKNEESLSSVVFNRKFHLHDISHDTEWKSEGIRFLIDRLKTYFELGGDEFKSVNPFEDLGIFLFGESVESLYSRDDDACVLHCNDADHVLETVKRHIQLQTKNELDGEYVKQIDTKHFQTEIKNRYESYGGVGAPVFSR